MEPMKPEIKTISPTDMNKLDLFRYYAEQKYDGMLTYYRNGLLFSDRMNIVKAPRVTDALKGLNIPPDTILMGELYVQGGNVFDVRTKANIDKVRYCVFDIIVSHGECVKNRPIEERKEILSKLVNPYATECIDFPAVGNYTDMWAIVEANQQEGLVLKPKGSKLGEGWLKCKRLIEAKLRIIAYDPKENNSKGAFILEGGNRCDALSQTYVQQYNEIMAKGKTAIAEIEYPFLTKDGHLFQPRMRQITEI